MTFTKEDNDFSAKVHGTSTGEAGNGEDTIDVIDAEEVDGHSRVTDFPSLLVSAEPSENSTWPRGRISLAKELL
jgi:hypothetical protein